MFRMLVSLNSRQYLRDKASSPEATFLHLSAIPATGSNHRQGQNPLSVHIQTVSKTDYGCRTPAYSASFDAVSLFRSVETDM